MSPFAQAEKLWQSIKSGKRGNKSSSESFNAYSTSSSESESDSSSSDVDGGNTRGGSTPREGKEENQQRRIRRIRKDLSRLRLQTPRRTTRLFSARYSGHLATRSCRSCKSVRDRRLLASTGSASVHLSHRFNRQAHGRFNTTPSAV